jgi:hypothetical protein
MGDGLPGHITADDQDALLPGVSRGTQSGGQKVMFESVGYPSGASLDVSSSLGVPGDRWGVILNPVIIERIGCPHLGETSKQIGP